MMDGVSCFCGIGDEVSGLCRSVRRQLPIFVLFLAGCTPEELSFHDRVSKEITGHMDSPGGYDSIDEYSRYFFLKSDQLVEAVFVIHDKDFREDVKSTCQKL
jgi:hypothetical protein